ALRCEPLADEPRLGAGRRRHLLGRPRRLGECLDARRVHHATSFATTGTASGLRARAESACVSHIRCSTRTTRGSWRSCSRIGPSTYACACAREANRYTPPSSPAASSRIQTFQMRPGAAAIARAGPVAPARMAPGEVRVVVRTCRIVVDIGTSLPAVAGCEVHAAAATGKDEAVMRSE